MNLDLYSSFLCLFESLLSGAYGSGEIDCISELVCLVMALADVIDSHTVVMTQI